MGTFVGRATHDDDIVAVNMLLTFFCWLGTTRRPRRRTTPHGMVRQDISVLRQTVQASQSMDLKDESGGRRDVQSTLATVTATSEARIRTLNNKVRNCYLYGATMWSQEYNGVDCDQAEIRHVGL